MGYCGDTICDPNLNEDCSTCSFDCGTCPPAGGLLVHWKFDEGSGTTASDSSGNGRTGTLVNGPVWTTNAKVLPYALDFDGSNDYVDGGTFDITGNAMTLSAWIRPNNIAGCVGDDCRIITKSNEQSLSNAWWSLSTSRSDQQNADSNTGTAGVKFMLKTNGATTTLKSNNEPLKNFVWTHLAAVYDGINMMTYVDGAEVGRTSKSGNIDQNAGVPVWVGATKSNAPPSDEFPGIIDDARVYPKALSQSEVQAVMNG